MSRRRLLLLSAFLSWLASSAHAALLVVGPGGFPDIQDAIDAAQAGDTILVQPGAYSKFVLSKPLRVLGVGSAQVTADGCEITGIAAGDEALVSGMSMGLFTKVEVIGNPGTVALHDVIVSGPPPFSADATAMDFLNNGRVFLLSSESPGMGKGILQPVLRVETTTLHVANGIYKGYGPIAALMLYGSGAPVMTAMQSAVTLARTSLVGGNGSYCTFCGPVGANGGHALVATQSSVEIVGGPGTELRGGDADGPPGFVGGIGLWLQQGSDALVQADAPIAGGLDSAGTQAPATLIDPSSTLTVETAALSTAYITPSQGAVGGTAAFVIEGSPGTPVLAAASLAFGPSLTFPGVFGTLFLDLGSLAVLGSFTLGPSGQASVPLAIPASPGLLGSIPAFQALQAGALPAFTNPAVLAIVF